MMKKTKSTSVHKNALLHGVYADDLVLPWENEQDFIDLHKAFRDDLEPDGPAEEEAVLTMAGLSWKKRRLAIGSQLCYRRNPNAAALTEAGETGWSGVAEYVQSTSGQTETLNDTLRSLAKSHAHVLHTSFTKVNEALVRLKLAPPSQSEGLERHAELRKASRVERENEQLEALSELTNALNAIDTGVITPILKLIENQDIEARVAERAFRPDIIEREVKLGALIDAQMGKTLVRIVQLKEYKRLYKKKQATGFTRDHAEA